MELKIPSKDFTKSERAWLAQLIQELKTVHAVSGRNTTVSDNDDGQVINADDCEACP